jgi:catechol 2,3-dioxygenase-like lactoylglutathione lyase family enzyme
MTNTMTHISLLVEDVQDALHFYQDNLGLEVIENLGNYATLKANENLKLSFFPRIAMQEALPSVQLSPVHGYRTVLEFFVEELDSVCMTLQAKGIQFVSEPTDHPDWGIRTAYFIDPDGNLVELFRNLK